MPNQIEDYMCEKCAKKVNITEKKYLADLPNVLIIHLQRINFNYETERQEKINSRFEFPKELNLKQYTIEDKLYKESNKNKDNNIDNKDEDNNTTDENESKENPFETDEIYFKTDDYYEYYLVGVIIHDGSAEAGHYYSYINSQRGGDKDQSFSGNTTESWLKFNDSYISKYNFESGLESDCFGGKYGNSSDDCPVIFMNNNMSFYGGFGRNSGEKSHSAYLLVYERKIKSPLKIVVEKPEITTNTNIISYKEEEAAKIKKKFDICRKVTGSKTKVLDLRSELESIVFYDASKEEYFQYKPFYSYERLIPKKYYLELEEDNNQFLNKQNLSDHHFVSFFESVIEELDKTLAKANETNSEILGKIAAQLLNFIFNILCQKDKQQVNSNINIILNFINLLTY